MTYSVTDLAELIRHHLVLSVEDDETADANLARLVSEVQLMSTRRLWREVSWVFCDSCGCSVDTDLMSVLRRGRFSAFWRVRRRS